MNQGILMAMMGFAALLGAIGQILLKKATDKLQLTLPGIITNYPLIGFAILYGVAVLINIYAYKAGGKVSLLYPMISLSYAASAILAWKFLGEQISIYTVIGITVILIGITFIGIGASAA